MGKVGSCPPLESLGEILEGRGKGGKREGRGKKRRKGKREARENGKEKKGNCKRGGGKLKMERGKVWKWVEDLFSLFETTGICFGFTKMEISTGKKAFHAGKKCDFAPSEKYSSYATVYRHLLWGKFSNLTYLWLHTWLRPWVSRWASGIARGKGGMWSKFKKKGMWTNHLSSLCTVVCRSSVHKGCFKREKSIWVFILGHKMGTVC